MIVSPSPTRAEVSDVATAIYDGADAVMLSAETAAGAWPIEAVSIMDRIAQQVESDPDFYKRIHFTETPADSTTADALAEASGRIVDTIETSAIVCFTSSGSTARRISRERPSVPLLVLTASQSPPGAPLGRFCCADQGYWIVRGNGRQGEAHGAALSFGAGGRTHCHHGWRTIWHTGFNKCAAHRPADRRRAEGPLTAVCAIRGAKDCCRHSYKTGILRRSHGHKPLASSHGPSMR